jgi:hypothetical protein
LRADRVRGPFDHRLSAERLLDKPRLRHVPLTLAGAGRRPFADGVDQRAACRPVGDLVGRQVELQQAHRTFDVDADRAGVDVRRRDEDAADRRTVAEVAVRVEDQVGDARREPRVDRLLEAGVIERVADGRRADEGDGLRLAARREDGGGRAGGDERVHVK